MSRVALSLASLVVSAAICAAAAYNLNNGLTGSITSRLGGGVFWFGGVTLVLSVPGYLAALGMIARLNSIRGWWYWLFLELGSLLGPLSLVCWWIYLCWRVPGIGGSDAIATPMLIWSFCVSTLTTFLYLSVAQGYGYMSRR